MNTCPITYRQCGENKYSPEGLHMLNTRLDELLPLPLSALEQRREAIRLAGKLSIQGMQPKLSAVLSLNEATFIPVAKYGHYILKPQHADYPQLPENEGITMHLARVAGLEVPLSGLVFSADGSMTYFIRRFDRVGRFGKLATEDFAQLAGRERSTKYDYSMEKIVNLIDRYCSFPHVEKARLFQRFLYFWLTGNEDMHLKNFSVIRQNGKVTLSPLYDCLNSTAVYLALGRDYDGIEEIALPLNGKKKNLTMRDIIDYFGKDRLSLTGKVIDKTIQQFAAVMDEWIPLIDRSFLNDDIKKPYKEVLERRRAVLKI
ncbi:MAG: type II toxin-antitoxin system HipA family toxin [Candidatus Aegiribacteria sp.]|nr:type II toxin-antitoxin system HipA family toxin [Candidatus Aegiribacteria sp.]MBD3295335.1 type II toxin-antitoxin system HipA family toxin [Candidatus Fermentibacteria bacterium]